MRLPDVGAGGEVGRLEGLRRHPTDRQLSGTHLVVVVALVYITTETEVANLHHFAIVHKTISRGQVTATQKAGGG